MSKHTPEPWHHHISKRDGSSFITDRPVEQPFHGVTIAIPGTNGNAKADHARAVQCVNALANVPDPMAFMSAACAEVQRHRESSDDNCHCALCCIILGRKKP